jgi:hypothetical protein
VYKRVNRFIGAFEAAEMYFTDANMIGRKYLDESETVITMIFGGEGIEPEFFGRDL